LMADHGHGWGTVGRLRGVVCWRRRVVDRGRGVVGRGRRVVAVSLGLVVDGYGGDGSSYRHHLYWLHVGDVVVAETSLVVTLLAIKAEAILAELVLNSQEPALTLAVLAALPGSWHRHGTGGRQSLWCSVEGSWCVVWGWVC